MSDLKISGLKIGAEASLAKLDGKDSSKGFGEIMQEAMGKLSQVQENTDMAIKDLASGGDITQAIIAMEKADMSFQLMVEVRNKLLTAYEEISRMQI